MVGLPGRSGTVGNVEGSGSSPFKTWHLPVAVAGIAVPIVAATMLAGAPAGLAAAFAIAATIVFVAARATPREPIEIARGAGDRPYLLVIACTTLADPFAVESIAAFAGDIAADSHHLTEVLVVAPAAGSRLQHWLSDLGPARLEAQELLAVSLAGLAAGDLDASGRVGDPDPVVATEDTLRTFPADAVMFVGEIDDDRLATAAVDVRRRLTIPVRHLALGPAPVG
jgi:hypothetical protein